MLASLLHNFLGALKSSQPNPCMEEINSRSGLRKAWVIFTLRKPASLVPLFFNRGFPCVHGHAGLRDAHRDHGRCESRRSCSSCSERTALCYDDALNFALDSVEAPMPGWLASPRLAQTL